MADVQHASSSAPNASSPSLIASMFRTKPLHVIDAEEKKEDLERTLGMFDLICLGMGATIGSGVFSTTGLMISTIAGPAAVLSWLVGGVVCVFNTFAYMELSTRIPSGGSTYAYSYHGIGELPAVIAAWLVSLEYSISAAGVARSWADKVQEWLLLEHPNNNFDWLNLKHANLLGGLIQFLSMVVLLLGVRFSKNFVNTFTIMKVSVVAFIVVAGLAALNTENLSPFIPKRTELEGVGKAFGFQGVITGASQAFFGFSGFDEVCCLSGEARNAKRNVPIAVMIVVVATVLISALCSFVLSGMIPYLDAGSFADGFEYHGWKWAGTIVRAGETVTMPVVVLVGFLAQPRVNYALACDGLIPKIFAQVDSRKNLFWNILISGLFLTVVAIVLPFDTLWDIVNFGVMMSFILANVALLNIRTREASPVLGGQLIFALVALTGLAAFLYQEGSVNQGSDVCLVLAIVCLVLSVGVTVFYYVKCPQQTNQALYFAAPLVPFIPAFSILADWYMIAQLSHRGLALSCAWVAAAIVSYAAYGHWYSAGRNGWNVLLTYNKLQTPLGLSAPMLSVEEGRAATSSESRKGNHNYTS
ncbi:hypothetical protein Gpo141_00010458 [Globisporangium polare]